LRLGLVGCGKHPAGPLSVRPLGPFIGQRFRVYTLSYGGQQGKYLIVVKRGKPAGRSEKERLRRPKGSGKHPIVPMRLDPVLVAEIDKAANKRGTTRTGQIRQWIEEGLKRRPKV
jgi:hypothetical protein